MALLGTFHMFFPFGVGTHVGPRRLASSHLRAQCHSHSGSMVAQSETTAGSVGQLMSYQYSCRAGGHEAGWTLVRSERLATLRDSAFLHPACHSVVLSHLITNITDH